MDQKFIKFYRVAALPATGEVGGLYFVYTAGKVGKLYVCTTSTEFELYSGVHASELTTALNDYVRNTLTIAGIDLKDNITAEELQTALGLGTAAYKAVEDFDAAGAADAVKTALVNGETKFIDFKAVGDELRALAQNAGAKVADVTVGGTSVVNAEHVAVLGTAAGKNEEYFVKSEGYVAYSEAEKTKLAGIEEGAEVNIIEEVQVNGVALEVSTDGKRAVNVVIPDATVKGVKGGEKVLALDSADGMLSTTISMEYKSTSEGGDGYIYLKGIGGAELGKIDAAEFVKDGMIDSVVMDENNVLTITWNTASGKTEATTIDFSKYIDTFTHYGAANGIKVEDDKYVGVVDPASETFLTVGEAGFKLAGVQDAIDAAKGEAIAAIAPAIAELDATVGSQTVAEGKHIAVEVVETDGKLTGLTIVESDIASDARLAEIELVTSASLNEHHAQLVDHENRITTLEGAVEDLEGAIADKNVDAEGDSLVSATATNNKVTVAATQDLKNAVDAANKAVQTIASAEETIQVTRAEGSNDVNLELVWQSF